MLESCGLNDLSDLYAHLPASALLNRTLDIPKGVSEYEITEYFQTQAAKNAEGYASFLGAGVYSHYRPVLCDVVVSRGEFLTSYTPYQAEIAQGTLTTIFEFQTMVCQLTGMEVANASMYDGSTAVPEAAMMALRITGRKSFLAAGNLHPEYRQVLDTAARNAQLNVTSFGYDARTGRIDLADLEAKLNSGIACVILQSPNFFGVVEDVTAAAELAHKHGALLVMVFTEAVSLGLLEPPRDADIVVGELQSFAISPSYGGPFAGIIATKEKFIRQMPGRLVGQTVDSRGNRAFCLTLSTREQHIRREKATSNICTNSGLCALAFSIHMTLLGEKGLRALAEVNHANACAAAERLAQVPGVELVTPRFFNEFTLRMPRETRPVVRALADRGILGGVSLGRLYPDGDGRENGLVVAVTETVTPEDVEAYASALEELLS